MGLKENIQILDGLTKKYQALYNEVEQLPDCLEIRYALAHLQSSIENVKKSLDNRTNFWQKATKK